MIWFWHNENDHPIILGDDGEFYFYGEDSVSIERGSDDGWYWCKLNKMQDVTPLNDWSGHEIMDPDTGYWIPWDQAPKELVERVHRQAKDPDWADRV